MRLALPLLSSKGFEFVLEGVLQAVADEGDVYANPAAVEALGGGDGGAAAAEGVQHHVALVAAGADDAFQQGLGLLGG